MKIEGIIWLRDIVDKLAFKHRVETDEVEEVLGGKPKFRFIEKRRTGGRGCIPGTGTNRCRTILVRPLHLQEDKRSVDIERQRYGEEGEKAIWQKVRPSPCPTLHPSMHS